MSKLVRQKLLDSVQQEMAELLVVASQVDEAMAGHFEVNRTDLRCLTLLELRGPMPAGRLAQEAGLSPAAMTVCLDRLERGGHVRRTPDDQDRRRILVEPTPAARERMQTLNGVLVTASRTRLARYSDAQLTLFRDMLREGRALKTEQALGLLKPGK